MNTTQKTMAELAKTCTEEEREQLDEACHQAASALASNANNGGVESQIEFLQKVGGLSEREILETIA